MYSNMILNHIIFTIIELHKKEKLNLSPIFCNMLIGEDFAKIVFNFNGLTLLEPNALITDLMMGSMSLFFALRLRKRRSEHSFIKYWYYFFLTFGIGSVCGGFAHTFFLYVGPQGKFPTWISAILCAYFIEKAMIKSVNDLNCNNLLGKIAFSKMILVFLVVITVISTEAYQKEHTIGFIPIAINTLIGVFISVALISLYNVKQGYVNFKYLLWGVLVMLPSFFIFLFKINPIQWFDKSDLSHIIIIAGNCFFYLGLQKLDYSERPFLS